MEKIDLIKSAFTDALKDFFQHDRLSDPNLPINSIQEYFKENPEDIIDLEIILKRMIIQESFKKDK